MAIRALARIRIQVRRLYRVEDSWREPGLSGFQVCRYRLVQLGQDGTPLPIPPGTIPPGPAPRAESSVQRIVRNTAVSRQVKALHNYICQVCGELIAIAGGPYAEGAHIRPLGRLHDGPDVAANVLCLCPNDHVRFEFGVEQLGRVQHQHQRWNKTASRNRNLR